MKQFIIFFIALLFSSLNCFAMERQEPTEPYCCLFEPPQQKQLIKKTLGTLVFTREITPQDNEGIKILSETIRSKDNEIIFLDFSIPSNLCVLNNETLVSLLHALSHENSKVETFLLNINDVEYWTIYLQNILIDALLNPNNKVRNLILKGYSTLPGNINRILKKLSVGKINIWYNQTPFNKIETIVTEPLFDLG